MDQPAAVIVLTTWPAATDAATSPAHLVGERLAACVNVLPEMESVYSWQGAVERERERQVIIKTTTARLEALERRVAELHPYEVPGVRRHAARRRERRLSRVAARARPKRLRRRRKVDMILPFA